jgi:hypothetical protein
MSRKAIMARARKALRRREAIKPIWRVVAADEPAPQDFPENGWIIKLHSEDDPYPAHTSAFTAFVAEIPD